jgi:hypothetical protein
MGVYIEVLAEHALSRERIKQSLTEILESLPPTIAQAEEIWKYWGHEPVRWPTQLFAEPPSAWSVSEPVGEDTPICLEARGPYSIDIDFWPRIAVIRPTPKWGAFVSDSKVEMAVRSVCRTIGTCIGASQLLYVPDSAYCPSRALDFVEQDIPLDAIVDWLRITCGPPSQDVPSIHQPLSDVEMDELIPSWRSYDDCRIYSANGYFVEVCS